MCVPSLHADTDMTECWVRWVPTELVYWEYN